MMSDLFYEVAITAILLLISVTIKQLASSLKFMSNVIYNQ